MSALVASRLTSPGPKRMLALDGGGVRGMISIGFLEAMEDLLRKRHARRDYVLADYFDMIGGTSVGSILATMLALGWPMEKVRSEFTRMCPQIFGRRIGWGIIRPRFSDAALRRHLEQTLGDMRLGSDEFRTGLAIVTKRLDTGSAWVVYNNPHARYWEGSVDSKGASSVGNRDFRVADIIRASTAAPTYFRPHWIQIHEASPGSSGKGLFVDGGLSPYNNPALLLFMMAGISGYRLGGCIESKDSATATRGVPWSVGADKLLIVSVGTGDFRVKVTSLRWMFAALFGGRALLGIMADSQSTTLKLLQWLANPKRPWTINSEIDDLRDDDFGQLIGASQAMLSFTRYNINLERDWLKNKLGVEHFSDGRLRRLRRLDDPDELHTYLGLSRKAAAYQVSEDDFPQRFDTPKVDG